MNLRNPALPPGWYPQSAEKIKQFLAQVRRDNPRAAAAVAPHAGWYYSGLIAAAAIASLRGDAETVVVVGGHLPAGHPVLVAMEDGALTPQGNLEMDGEFRDILAGELRALPDKYPDNTVEVELPMVKHFFPQSRLVALRFPADIDSFERGTIIAQTGASLGRNCVLLGSTDLTHYGGNYGFSPRGGGQKALDWVKTENDAAFIRAALSGDRAETLRRAGADFSACSAGAVLAVQGFAAARDAKCAELLAYATSADVSLAGGEGVPSSFVGYAALSWI
ncbi:MAG: AmmeMemoRadiSam system protein B [Treponema sp.]|nr:AmmeMemoRadiSam system protein B [Treponema sp.]